MAETTAEPAPAAPAAAPANDLDEESHYFDFGTFYKKPEFCDRAFKLVILDMRAKRAVQPCAPPKRAFEQRRRKQRARRSR
ncbi:BTB/POZ/Kelch-associated protein [Klebsormidium nitens]|uniref:BTB/POZ/Kelch-associated protein n=1 Tax=Klebsormidium nitens TaxID=105231 RepID=A0A1Y1HLY2_KLENI|nr:BTB/POZ/Kelch-associated protein [Klebsormidium nitens]|eukprot:GAQ79645.1 BTB/POZ/Kelch-associated protein [Klebsormidium nitens]